MMQRNVRLLGTAVFLVAALIASACAPRREAETTAQEKNGGVKAFTLVAEKARVELKPGVKIDAWTFGGTVPGPELRVTQGDLVRVTLRNRLPEPVTIHWHGMRVPNAMDGVPGVTQNAVAPGKAFTYEFVARDTGTYWYHSHQKSAEQVDRGLYGAIIVEPTQPAARHDRDYTLILDEWVRSPAKAADPHAAHGGGSAAAPAEGMAAYDVFTVNGRSGEAVRPVEVKEGERVRLRLVNAGYQLQLLRLQGHSFRVIETDGQPFEDPGLLRDTLIPVAPGERYDVEFVADNPGRWYLESVSENPAAAGMRVEIRYAGFAGPGPVATPAESKLPIFDLASYGKPRQAAFGPGAVYDVEYTMELGSRTTPTGAEQFTINGKAFPETEPIRVKKDDKVKVRLVNRSEVDHPMHLHGHFFQVLTKNGRPVSGTAVFKDTLNVRPGEEYEVAFLADDPGHWMFHCHELHHAAGGMVTEVVYEGFVPAFEPDPKAGNQGD